MWTLPRWQAQWPPLWPRTYFLELTSDRSDISTRCHSRGSDARHGRGTESEKKASRLQVLGLRGLEPQRKSERVGHG